MLAAFELLDEDWDVADLEVPKFSKSLIVEVGKALRGTIKDDSASQDRILEIFRVAHSWRAAHLVPMRHLRSELSSKLGSAGISGLTAARLKRMTSLRKKLRKAPHTLYQMQDIGGCRAILPSVAEVRAMQEVYAGKAKHELKHLDDYVTCPKSDGYRSVHLVYRYLGAGEFAKLNSSPMLVEVQLRTELQHAWATAVEAVGSIMGEDLKGGEGSSDWLRFFALISSEIAHAEGCPLVPGTPESDADRRKEIVSLDAKLSAVSSLNKLRAAVQAVSSLRVRHSKAYIVSLDAVQQTVAIQPLSKGGAVDSYRSAEMKSATSVLIEVDRAEDLRAAYPNYFLDVGEFTSFVSKVIRTATRKPSSSDGLLRFLINANWRR